MAGVVTTSIVINFGEGAEDYHLSAEVDSRPEGYNKGKTSFVPGDSPYIIVYKSPELSLSFEVSTGNLSSRGSEPIAQEEFLVFANESSKELAKPPAGNVTLKHLAGGTGASVDGRGVVKLSEPDISVYKANYNATGYIYRLTGIPLLLSGESTFPVLIFITGTAS